MLRTFHPIFPECDPVVILTMISKKMDSKNILIIRQRMGKITNYTILK